MTQSEKMWIARITAPVCLLAMGGTLYYLLEILMRGWSHWTMAVCGGLCLLFIYYVNCRFTHLSLLLRAILSTVIITAVELTAGCLLNIGLGLAIWNYSQHRFNLLGQISLYASARWLLLSIPVCIGCRWVERHVFDPNVW